MKTQRLYVTDFVGLDLLRFALSLVVVLRHYYFFYYSHIQLDQIVSSQPFFSILGILYKWGGCAVQVFWLISGLIFYSVYHAEIVKNEVSFKEFIFFRFSRLYPLHFITLIIVAALQVWHSVVHGEFFMYQTQDVKHFIDQLLFVSAWRPSFQHSFNIPVWSVSVEILVYIVFFFLAAAGVLKNRSLFVITSLTILLYILDIFAPFSQCLSFFFSGCLLTRLLNDYRNNWGLLMKYIAASALVGGLFIGARYLNPTLNGQTFDMLLNLTLLPFSSAIVLGSILVFRRLTSQFIISIFKALGDMTYSLYLIHFPIILSIVLLFNPPDHSMYDKPVTLIAFFGVSILAARFVFIYFEKPAQRFLRKRFEIWQRQRTVNGDSENEGSVEAAA